jgi:hypothetical protein
LILSADHDEFLYVPQATSQITTAVGGKVRLACPGTDNSFRNIPNKQQDIIVNCKDNDRWEFDPKNDPANGFSFDELICLKVRTFLNKLKF